MLKKFVDVLPFFSIIAIILTFANLYFYYSQFSIEISNYIDVSEFFLFLLPVYTKYSIVFFAFAFSILIYKPDILSQVFEGNLSERTLFIMFTVTIALMFALAVPTFFPASISQIGGNYLKNADLGAMICTVFLMAIAIYYKQRNFKKYVYWSSLCTFSFVIITMFQYAEARQSARQILIDGSEKEVHFKYGDLNIKLNNFPLAYIGETKGFIFVYNRSYHNTMIFKKEKVENLTFSLSGEFPPNDSMLLKPVNYIPVPISQ